ncbi:hypothetical protein QEN19_003022 [Hanseniaspora menglaensis]
MSLGTEKSLYEIPETAILLKVQINAHDQYTIDYSGDEYETVPVIRIYGKTDTNSNILVHIHDVFPYFLIKKPLQIKDSDVGKDCEALHKNLEALLSDFYAKKKTHEDENEEDIDRDINYIPTEVDSLYTDETLLKFPKRQFRRKHLNLKQKKQSSSFKYIAKVEPVKGREFYGYYEEYEVFYKVSLLKPNSLNRLVSLLQKPENVMVVPNTKNHDCLKILEAHLPYFLQFCIDYNLYGCSWLKLRDFSYREPIFDQRGAEIFNDNEFLNIIENLHPSNLARMGNSLLEIDIRPEQIANTEDFLILPSSDPKDVLSSTREVWETLNSIRKNIGLDTYKNTQSQGQATKRKEFHNEKHEIIQKSYESLVEIDKKKKFVKNSSSSKIEKLPTLLELIVKKKISKVTEKNESYFNSDSISPRKLTAKSDDNKRQKTLAIHDFTQRQKSINESGLGEEQMLTFNNIEESLEDLGLKKHEYDSPFFQDHQEFVKSKLKNQLLSDVPVKCSDPMSKSTVTFQGKTATTTDLIYNNSGLLEYIHSPPTYNEILSHTNKRSTKLNPHGSFFESQTQNIISKIWKHKHKLMKNKISVHSKNNQKSIHLPISIMFLELTTTTQMSGKLPDPKADQILMLTWRLKNGDVGRLEHKSGMFVLMKENTNEHILFLNQMARHQKKEFEIVLYDSEIELVTKFAEFVAILDPDLLCGFEVHNDSWGFFLNKGDYLGVDLASILSRVNHSQINKMGDAWGYTHASSIRITGRHVINLWRVLKNETKLESYTLENFVYHILHKRIPKFSADNIYLQWCNQNYKVLIHYNIVKVSVCVDMVNTLTIIEKISEQARLTGVDFYSVIYRGSQFKVESLLSRICRRENYVMYSPSQKNVRSQKPMESIALIMEPDSQMYTDPVVVLDFQSLYPSIMIAFNLCYSTLIGDTALIQKTKNSMLGADKNFKLADGVLNHIGLENLLLTTNGSLFLQDNKRTGVLGKMLTNLLETRVMIKTTMSDLKKHGTNNGFDTLLRDLEGMQIALKFVLNVTYGYTAASHSGRMPLQELADSIVEMGRTVLTQSIHLINNSTKWGAKVVYTDTDSLFVLFPGKTREEAFKFGREMAKIITENNLSPIRLKFEKLYHPCILVTKKRYVGNMYETESVTEPVLQAKGLEIIRRDGTPLLQKLMETSVKLLFDSCNITVVQNFITAEFEKLYRGKYLIQDLCFSRKVKLGHYKKENTLPPAAYLAKEAMDDDVRAEAQYKQTVRYVVVQKKDKKALLREKAMTPVDFMKNRRNQNLQLDMEYYIVKHLISPLNRIYNLIGIDCYPWFENVKNKFTNNFETSFQNKSVNSKLLHKVSVKYCEKCHETRILPNMNICFKCLKHYEIFIKNERDQFKDMMKREVLNNICETCIGFDNKNLVGQCISQDCPIYYQREDNR